MRTAAHQFVAHQTHRIVAARRHHLASAFFLTLPPPDFEKVRALCVCHDELNPARIQNDSTDSFTRALAQDDADLAALRIGKVEMSSAFLCSMLPIQLCPQPSGQKDGRRSKSGRKIDARIFNFNKVMMRRG